MANYVLLLTSIIFFLLSIFLYSKPIKYKFTIFFYFFTYFLSLFLFITYAVSDYLSGNGIDNSVIFHLKYGLKGAGFAEYKSLIIIVLSLLLLLTILLFIFLIKKNRNGKMQFISISFILISLISNPAIIDIYKAFNTDYSTSNEFYQHYKTPHIKQISDNTKNFVFIYAESLEHTYFNERVFPGLIKSLRNINGNVLSFSNIRQVPGNGFTIGGFVNTLLGIPLVTASFVNSMAGMDKFLPSATGYVDLLHDEGYYLAFYGGARLTFAGKGKLLKTHSFDEVLGKDELLPRLKDKKYLNAWGLYDDTLLNIVYKRFIDLSKKNKKFGLFTLTLDTHHPNGHISKSCNILYKDGSNPILNAVASSEHLISKLINKILTSPYADNTVIVLVSDHIALRNSAYKQLHRFIKIKGKNRRVPRRNLFMIISPNKKGLSNYKIAGIYGSNFDIASTFLPFIGYSGDIGLGRNLLLNKGPNITLKKYIRLHRKKFLMARREKAYILRHLKNWKGTVMKFWDFPRLRKSIGIDIEKNTIQLDNRQFKLPILIELDEHFVTTLKFQFDISNKKQTLIGQLNNIGNDKSFLLINKGKEMKKLNNKLDTTNYYMIAGKGKNITKTIKIMKNITFSKKEIRIFLKYNQ